MEELFGLSMNWIMVGLLVILIPALTVIAVMAWRNQVMLKLGLRNIPRRRAQTVLIIVGIMISTLIMSAAFGTGDTINFSVRSQAVDALGPIDEIIVSARTSSLDRFGSSPYFPYAQVDELKTKFANFDGIDGFAAGIGEEVPAVNLRNFRSEGRMRVAGVDPSSIDQLGGIRTSSGESVRLEELATGEAFINQKAADELEALSGDTLRLVVGGEPRTVQVIGIVARGGLAGDQSTVILPLSHAQAMFGRADQVNSIVVSNKGDETKGASLSDDVTLRLRVHFADRAVASQLRDLLIQDGPWDALEERSLAIGGTRGEDISSLRDYLKLSEETGGTDDRLLGLLADEDVADEVLVTLENSGLHPEASQADTLFSDLGEFRVIDIKKQVLDGADEAASQVTAIFIVMGLFSILVGVLLIFLIFVMLAAARRSEMGMARAVGAKRRHLVQMFIFEGTSYALVSAAVGVAVGLGVSAIIVLVANQFIESFEEDLQFTTHFEFRSVVVAYCLGMVITLATVGISAYRVSRMNIVAAVRGLPTPVASTQSSWRAILTAPLNGAIRPPRLAGQSLVALVHAQPGPTITYFFRALWAVVLIPAITAGSLFQIVLRPFRQGWLAFLLGVLLTVAGMGADSAGLFRIGVSLAILGLGLMARNLLGRTQMHQESKDRLTATTTGLVMVGFWVLPFSTLRAVAGELDGGPEMFFISGVAMVASAVWVVIYNSDLMLAALTALTSRAGRLRPVVVTAVAYPMAAKFRTGLTLAMFALVIFTLIVVSILTEAFAISSENIVIATGDWDIEGRVNSATPLDDIGQAIEESELLSISDFAAIGGYTTAPIEARQIGASDSRWRFYAARAANDDFFDATGHRLKLIADGYGPTERDVWLALKDNPRLAVVDAAVVPSRGFGDDHNLFKLEGLRYEDDEMSPIEIEVRDPVTNSIFPITVIGVLDVQTDNFGNMGFGMITSKTNLDDALPFVVPITTYRFRIAEGGDAERIARDLDITFQENGLETDLLQDVVEEQRAASRAFNNLFTGYMAMGLMVGIAALGVVSLRAVVERRQQIGVLRAIGYRRRMIQLSFLLESSFIALLGIAIGVGLGTILAYNIVNDIRENIETIKFTIPWIQILIIVGLAYIFSLLTTFLPARQASRIYPAEALRYE